MLNVLAAASYACVAVVCAVAAWSHWKPDGDRRQVTVWVALAAFFAAFAIWRMFDVEAAVEQAIREQIFGRGGYFARDRIQRPLAMLLLAGLALAAIWAFLDPGSRRSHRRYDRCARWAGYCVVALCGLVALRLISFHPVDTLLYNGPHLNRVIEPALVLFAGLQALVSMRQLSRHRQVGERPRK